MNTNYDPNDYTYHQPENGIVVQIGDNCTDLDRLLEDFNANSACWLTISNPDGPPLIEQSEEAVCTRLLAEILNKVSERSVLRGFVIDQSQKQYQKQAFLVIGLSKKSAKELAFTYSQNSFVYYKRNERAELVTTTIGQALLRWKQYLINGNKIIDGKPRIGSEFQISGPSFRYIGTYLDNQEGIEPYFPYQDYPGTWEMAWTQFLMRADPNIILSVIAFIVADPFHELDKQDLKKLDDSILTGLARIVDKYTDEYNDVALPWDKYFECFTFGRFGDYAVPKAEFPKVYFEGELWEQEKFDDMFMSSRPVFIHSEYYHHFIEDLCDISLQILRAIWVRRSNF